MEAMPCNSNDKGNAAENVRQTFFVSSWKNCSSVTEEAKQKHNWQNIINKVKWKQSTGKILYKRIKICKCLVDSKICCPFFFFFLIKAPFILLLFNLCFLNTRQLNIAHNGLIAIWQSWFHFAYLQGWNSSEPYISKYFVATNDEV